MIPRYRITTTEHRDFIVYAETPVEACEKIRKIGMAPLMLMPFGHYDPVRNVIIGDIEPTVVVGDVHARPQPTKPREPLIVQVPSVLSRVVEQVRRESKSNGVHAKAPR